MLLSVTLVKEIVRSQVQWIFTFRSLRQDDNNTINHCWNKRKIFNDLISIESKRAILFVWVHHIPHEATNNACPCANGRRWWCHQSLPNAHISQVQSMLCDVLRAQSFNNIDNYKASGKKGWLVQTIIHLVEQLKEFMRFINECHYKLLIV